MRVFWKRHKTIMLLYANLDIIVFDGINTDELILCFKEQYEDIL